MKPSKKDAFRGLAYGALTATVIEIVVAAWVRGSSRGVPTEMFVLLAAATLFAIVAGRLREKLVLVGCVSVATVAVFSLPAFSQRSERASSRTMNFALLRMAGSQILFEAQENGGRLPPSLSDFSFGGAAGSPPRYRDMDSEWPRNFDWLYFPTGDLLGQPETYVIIASPTTLRSSTDGSDYRIILARSGDVTSISEADYQSRIRIQLHAAPN